MSYKNPADVKKAKTDRVLRKIEKRGHILLNGEYHNRESKMLVYCEIHDKKHDHGQRP
jgi:hypothetical protein